MRIVILAIVGLLTACPGPKEARRPGSSEVLVELGSEVSLEARLSESACTPLGERRPEFFTALARFATRILLPAGSEAPFVMEVDASEESIRWGDGSQAAWRVGIDARSRQGVVIVESDDRSDYYCAVVTTDGETVIVLRNYLTMVAD